MASLDDVREEEAKVLSAQSKFLSASYVDIVALIHDEFGTPVTVIRSQIGMGTISLNGMLWTGDKYKIPYSEMEGKTLIVIGPDRRFIVKYQG
jgi:hypothetical protein